MTQETMVRYET